MSRAPGAFGEPSVDSGLSVWGVGLVEIMRGRVKQLHWSRLRAAMVLAKVEPCSPHVDVPSAQNLAMSSSIARGGSGRGGCPPHARWLTWPSLVLDWSMWPFPMLEDTPVASKS